MSLSATNIEQIEEFRRIIIPCQIKLSILCSELLRRADWIVFDWQFCLCRQELVLKKRMVMKTIEFSLVLKFYYSNHQLKIIQGEGLWKELNVPMWEQPSKYWEREIQRDLVLTLKKYIYINIKKIKCGCFCVIRIPRDLSKQFWVN